MIFEETCFEAFFGEMSVSRGWHEFSHGDTQYKLQYRYKNFSVPPYMDLRSCWDKEGQ